VSGLHAQAIETVWSYNGNGNWHEAEKWSNGTPIDPTFNATIDDDDAAATVTLNISASVGNLLIGQDDSLRIRSDSAETAVLNVFQNVENHGSLALGSTFQGNGAELSIEAGGLTNHGTGVLHFQIGGVSARRLSGDLFNDGLVLIDAPFTTFDKPNARYVNNGQFTLFYTSTLAVENGTFNQNAGAFDADSMLTFRASLLNLNGGTFRAAGGAELTNTMLTVFGGEHFAGGIASLSNSSIQVFGGLITLTAQVTFADGTPNEPPQSVGFQQTGGTTVLNGQLISPVPVQFFGGRLLGHGTVVGPLEIAGAAVEPGESIGTFSVDGDYQQQSAARLVVEISGRQTGEYDMLAVTQSAALGGTLEARLVEGPVGAFSPSLGDTFDVLTAVGGIRGRFEQHLLPPLTGHLQWNVHYGADRVSLTVVPEGPAAALFLFGALPFFGKRLDHRPR
jgi:hypothetical protein